jgi:two-component system phosphate regulon sensor histidine kinase PhoR
LGDNGGGISREHLPRLFERLYRVDSSRSGGSNHSGIGLSIVAATIRSHGGRYGVESEVGIGSTFWFEIPAPR